jgi:acyl carrier protein
MKIEESKKIVISIIKKTLNSKEIINEQTRLIGEDSSLDSMKLVEVCVNLEDEAEKHGFEFNWTSENSMSKSQSIFRNVASLSEEFARQSELKV